MWDRFIVRLILNRGGNPTDGTVIQPRWFEQKSKSHVRSVVTKCGYDQG